MWLSVGQVAHPACVLPDFSWTSSGLGLFLGGLDCCVGCACVMLPQSCHLARVAGTSWAFRDVPKWHQLECVNCHVYSAGIPMQWETIFCSSLCSLQEHWND